MATEYRHIKTDAERLEVLPTVKWWDWGVVADWEEEAQTEEARQEFHNTARHLYHLEEWHNGTL